VIYLLRIDIPDIILGLDTVYDIFHGFEGSDHGVVNIVIPVLAVAADTVQVVYGLKVIHKGIDILVGIEVGRICLFDTFHMGIHDIVRRVDQPHVYDFIDGEFGEFFVGHTPVFISLEAEIFQADPDSMLQILDHIGGPVVVDLETAQHDVAVVDINPAVGNDIADSF